MAEVVVVVGCPASAGRGRLVVLVVRILVAALVVDALSLALREHSSTSSIRTLDRRLNSVDRLPLLPVLRSEALARLSVSQEVLP